MRKRQNQKRNAWPLVLLIQTATGTLTTMLFWSVYFLKIAPPLIKTAQPASVEKEDAPHVMTVNGIERAFNKTRILL